MYFSLFTVLISAFLLLFPIFDNETYSLQNNTNNTETIALYRLQEIFGQERNSQIQAQGRVDIQPTYDATMFVMDIRRNWNMWGPMFREVAEDYFLTKGEGAVSLPKVANLSLQKVVREKHILPNWVVTQNFSIEWGNDINSTDNGIVSDKIVNCSTGIPCTGIPDIIDRWADYFEDVWTKEIGMLGYLQPTGTQGYLYDVYIANTGDNIKGNDDDMTPTLDYKYVGLTVTYCDYDICKDDVSTSYSYIGVNNNIRDTDTMKITAAHEFFHAIQFSYPTIDYWFYPGKGWWLEATATWMEEMVYDEVNSYYSRVRTWLANPSLSLKNSGSHEYGDVIFIIFLTDVYLKDPDFVRYVWESGDSGIDGIDGILFSRYNTNFESAFKDFVALNAVAGRSGTWGGYEEGAQYGSATVARAHSGYPVLFSEVTGTSAPQDLGSSYIKFLSPDNRNNRLIIEFDGTNGVNWASMVVKVKSDGTGYETGEMALNSTTKYGCHSIDGFGTGYSEVFLVATVLIDPDLGESAPYYYRASIDGVCENTTDANLIRDEVSVNNNKTNNDRCFIATAAFGSSESPYVRILQEFKDKYLTPYSIGRGFVHLYYTVSPSIADFMKAHPGVAIFVRIFLYPAIGIAFLFIKVTFVEKVALIIIFLIIFLFWVLKLFRCHQIS